MTSPSPPASPDARPVLKARKRSGGAAYHITEECERLFCGTLKAVFLVERNTGLENSLVMDMRNTNIDTKWIASKGRQHTFMKHDLPTPSPSPPSVPMTTKTASVVTDYVEVWDYAAGTRFRGFVAERQSERGLFVFFDREVIGQDLKPG